jgi:transcriptional regulator with XRE-family HTH domain
VARYGGAVPNEDGELIRRCRLDAGLTQAELARRLDTTQSAVARWESGKVSPTLANLRRILSTCGWELEITPSSVTMLDESDVEASEWSAVERNLTLTHAQRFDRMVTAANLVLDGRRAMAEAER